MLSFTISYDPLWRTLATRRIHKIDLVKNGIITGNTLKRMRNCEPVSLNVIGNICVGLGVGVQDVVEFKVLGSV